MCETEKIQVHRVEVLIIDTDKLGSKSVKTVLENTAFPNHCMSPQVMGIKTCVVDWSDAHPLNQNATRDQTYRELFGASDD